MENIKLYPRKCDSCGQGMEQGYIINWSYYCDNTCRSTIMTDKEWKEHYTDDGEDCWTEWHELESDINYTKNGQEVENIQ